MTNENRIDLHLESTNRHQRFANVPLPESWAKTTNDFLLTDNEDKHITATFVERSHWPDHSIQWLQITWRETPHSRKLKLSRIAGALPSDSQSDHTRMCRDEFAQISNNALRLGSTCDVTVEVELEDGKLLKTSELKAVNEESANHSSQCFSAVLKNTRTNEKLELLLQTNRIGADALQGLTFSIRNTRAATHNGGIWELGDSKSTLIKRASIKFSPCNEERGSDVRNGHQEYRLTNADEWKSVTGSNLQLDQITSGTPNAPTRIHRDRSGEIQFEGEGYRLNTEDMQFVGNRAEPSVLLAGESETVLGVHAPRFWQKFPQSLSVCPDGNLSWDVMSATSGRSHELLPGERLSAELTVAVGDLDKVKDMLGKPTFASGAKTSPNWCEFTQVVPWLTARDSSPSLDYLALVDQAIYGPDSFFQKREKVDQYGWRHFGDVWGDHEAVHSPAEDPLVSHYNNQYDMVLGLGINYLRSGDERWFELMRDLARHVIDIDIYHTDEDLPCYNHGMFWHTVHYVDAGLSTHRSYPRGTCGGGPSSGHAYNRGLYLYYCLTGDLTAKEAVINMGEWMIASEDGSKTKYRYLAGGETGLTTASGTEDYHGPGRGPANCVEVLVTAFEATHERRFMDQAEHIIRRVVHPEQDIEALDLLDSENKWFYLMFLQALGRYLEVKISLEEIDDMYSYAKLTLLRFADWMAEHEYPFLDKPEKLEFPTETWAAQDMRKTEVFQWAARHGSEHQKQIFLEKASFFFNESVRQLNEFETKSLCRPIALLLTNGYSHDFFASGQLDKLTPSPPPSVTTFAPHKTFRSQKMRAIRNAKIILGCIGFLAILLMAMIITILLRG